MSLPRKSQSALEYMMTYGWAILIIVIAAGVLYSLGVFSPSSFISTTITGFTGITVPAATCEQGGVLLLSVSNSFGDVIYITSINVSFNGHTQTEPISEYIGADGSANIALPHSCSVTAGTRFSSKVLISYEEPTKAFIGPFLTQGTIAGETSPPSSIPFSGGLAYTGVSNGCYVGDTVFNLTEGSLTPINNQYNGVYPITCSSTNLCNGWEFYGYIYLNSTATFREAADDSVSTYVRPAFNGSGYGKWYNVLASVYNSNLTWTGCCDEIQGVNFIGTGTFSGLTDTFKFVPGLYEISFDSSYDHACDGPWFSVTGGAWVGPVNVSVWTNANSATPVNGTTVLDSPTSPGNANIENVSSYPYSLYTYTGG